MTEAMREAIRQAAVFCECLTDDTCDRIASAVIRAAVEGTTSTDIDRLAVKLRGPWPDRADTPGYDDMARAALVSALAGGGET